MPDNKNAYLIVERGIPYYRREVFVVAGPKFTIGRPTDYNHPDLPLTSDCISRRHAEIERQHDTFFVRDYSKHGTKVNGVCVDKMKPYPLKQDDRIQLVENEAVIIFSLTNPSDETKDPPPHDIPITLDEGKREIYIEGKPIALNGNRYTLFRLLYQNRGTVVSKLTIMKEVWPMRQSDSNQPLVGDTEVAELVKRLKDQLGAHQSLISNKRGFGYMLK